MTSDELVEKMARAAMLAPHRNDIGTGTFDGVTAETRKIWVEDMSAALRVAVDELLCDPTPIETGIHDELCRSGYSWRSLKDFTVGRRAKLERPKTPEERVTISEGCGDFESWSVQFDGKTKVTFGRSKEDAEIYRKGLIADLKERGEWNE